MQYGPYTPQECQKVVDWLQNQNIKFEIIKDQEKENEYKSSDGSNIVKQAEFRTETFLAQIFYIEILEINEALSREFNKLFVTQIEVFPKSLTEKSETIDLNEAITKSIRSKRFWSWVLLGLWILFFAGYYFNHE